MFQQQTITIKSGTGNNYFEATASMDSLAQGTEIARVVDGLRKMQKDRMDWAAGQSKK